MSGRKNKHKQRGHQRGQPDDLLNELNSLRDLLGSDDIGDIPLLDQVASPGTPASPAQAPAQQPLDEIDLPILFSPVDEELPEDYRAELNESDLKLLRPLQDLPVAGRDRQSPAAKEQSHRAHDARKKEPGQEQQQELFAQPAATPVTENPFLPAHIRARLTGGRVPKSEDSPPEPAPAEASPIPEDVLDTEPAPDVPAAAVHAPAEAELPEAAAGSDSPATPDRSESERQQLIDRLVAKQLPELERQLRARIELMLDELEARD